MGGWVSHLKGQDAKPPGLNLQGKVFAEERNLFEKAFSTEEKP